MLYKYLHTHAFNSEREDGCYNDYYDGSLFKDIVKRRGRVDAVRWDVFISVSCDGFQTFQNARYDCWPVVAMLENLPPDVRFLLRNTVPLGVIKGPSEVIRLDSFLTPLVEEVNSLNANGGTKFEFWDGAVRRVQVHILFMKGDAPAIAKLSGTTGVNGVFPCRFCAISGTKAEGCTHNYYPSAFRVQDGKSGRSRMERHFYPNALPLRRTQDVQEVWRKHETLRSQNARTLLAKSTGIKPRTAVFDLPSIDPYTSFPIDLMHMVMNLVKDFMGFWKGEHMCAFRKEGGSLVYEDFVVDAKGWEMIDKEMEAIGFGTSQDVFGVRPRGTGEYKNWKAAECKAFILWYAPIVLQGHLPARYMKGVETFSRLMELCHRRSLTEEDVLKIRSLSLSFYNHFEKEYYRFEKARVRVCKTHLHYILHLAENVRLCGPLVNPSQFWMERFLGFIKHGLHATVRAAESLTENAKLGESCKLMFGEHVFVSEVEYSTGEDVHAEGDGGDAGGSAEEEVVRECRRVKLLFPM